MPMIKHYTKFGNGLVIASHILLGICLLIHAEKHSRFWRKPTMHPQHPLLCQNANKINWNLWYLIYIATLNFANCMIQLSGKRLLNAKVWLEMVLNITTSLFIKPTNTLHWRHNEPDGVSNHQPRDCLFNCLFSCRSKKTSKLSVTGLCAENSPGTGEFSAQMASNAENGSIWWRHHDMCQSVLFY